LMIVAVILWGASFIWLKMALETIAPPTLAAVRFSLASFILLLIVLPFSGIRRQILRRGPWTEFLVIGLLGTFLPSLLQNYGMVHLKAGISGVIQGAGPIYTAILAAVILGERLGRRKISGAALAFAGTVLLSTGFGNLGQTSAYGVVLLTLSAVSYSCYTVAVRRSLIGRMHPMALLTGATICGSVPLLIVTVLLEPAQSLVDFDISEGTLILLLVVLSTVVAYACYVSALNRLEASRAAAFLFLIPVSALSLGAFYLGETISIMEGLASGLILLGVIVTESERSRGRHA